MTRPQCRWCAVTQIYGVFTSSQTLHSAFTLPANSLCQAIRILWLNKWNVHHTTQSANTLQATCISAKHGYVDILYLSWIVGNWTSSVLTNWRGDVRLLNFVWSLLGRWSNRPLCVLPRGHPHGKAFVCKLTCFALFWPIVHMDSVNVFFWNLVSGWKNP